MISIMIIIGSIISMVTMDIIDIMETMDITVAMEMINMNMMKSISTKRSVIRNIRIIKSIRRKRVTKSIPIQAHQATQEAIARKSANTKHIKNTRNNNIIINIPEYNNCNANATNNYSNHLLPNPRCPNSNPNRENFPSNKCANSSTNGTTRTRT